MYLYEINNSMIRANPEKRLPKDQISDVAVGKGGGSVVAGWVWVLVEVAVGVKVLVGWGVEVGVSVEVGVAVLVGVIVGVFVGVKVGKRVGIIGAGVLVKIGVAV